VETFVIRLWTPESRRDERERGRLRGIAEHIGSGKEGAFQDASELLAFLASRLQAGGQEVEE
jgi:hypothetical protein